MITGDLQGGKGARKEVVLWEGNEMPPANPCRLPTVICNPHTYAISIIYNMLSPESRRRQKPVKCIYGSLQQQALQK